MCSCPLLTLDLKHTICKIMFNYKLLTSSFVEKQSVPCKYKYTKMHWLFQNKLPPPSKPQARAIIDRVMPVCQARPAGRIADKSKLLN